MFLEPTEQDVPGTYHALQNISGTKWTLVAIVYWKSVVARLENSEQHEGLDGESHFLPLLFLFSSDPHVCGDITN